MATTSETQADFEARIFGHYGCGDAVGDWEILVYSMLLDHAPDLISGETGRQGGAKRGRKRIYTPEMADALEAEILRVSSAPDAPPARCSRMGALRHMFGWGDFADRFGVDPRGKDQDKMAKALLSRLGEAKKLKADPPGKSET